MKKFIRKFKYLSKNKYFLTGFIGIFALLIVGVTYGFFVVDLQGERNISLDAGGIKFTYKESNTLDINILPMTDQEGEAQTDYFDFEVSLISNDPLSINYFIYIELLESIDFGEEYVKIYLTDQNNVELLPTKDLTELEEYNFESGEIVKQIYENTISSNSNVKTTDEYRLRAWIDPDGVSTSGSPTIIDNGDEQIITTGDEYAFKFKIDIANHEGIILESEFAYTGTYQEYVVPKTGYYEVELWGAEGYSDNTTLGGKGGYTKGSIYLTKGEKLYVYVGSNSSVWNGGGLTPNGGYAGRGATDIRYFPTTPTSTELNWDNITGLRSRIMVAGAGGTGRWSIGGAGGGLVAGAATNNEGGKGGTQRAGGVGGTSGGNVAGAQGTFGTGGDAGTGSSSGGGGYYGGGGGSWASSARGGGGGGSSYISGHAGVNSVTSASSTTASNNTNHYSNKYFIKTEMKSGLNTGNGKGIIKFIDSTLPKTNTKLNNVRYIKSCINGSTVNTGNYWVEIQAVKNGVNIAKGKTITGTVAQANATTGAYANIVDGMIDNTTGSSGFGQASATGLQCVTVDLGATYDLDEVALWSYWADGRTIYYNTLSVGSTNASGTTALSTVLHTYSGTAGYAESSQGKKYTAWD